MKNDAERSQLAIATLIRAFVYASAAIILFGLLMYLMTGKSGYESGMFPTSPIAIFQGILALKPYAIILSGLFILILTPILRVGISIFVFIREKDKIYVIITAAVFLILVLSLILGKVE